MENKKTYEDLENQIAEFKRHNDTLKLSILSDNGRDTKCVKCEQRLALALKGATDGLFDWDVVSNSIYYSPRWKEILGYRNEEIENEYDSWLKLLYKDDLDTAIKKLKIFLSGKKDNYESEFKMMHKDGTPRNILARGFAIRSESGEVIRIVGTHLDITKLKQTELELRKAKERAEENEAKFKELNSTKDKLFSIIAHDLRSPFSSILEYTELLIENIKDYNVKESQQFLSIISSSAKDTLVLLDNLLAWTLLQTGQIELRPKYIRLQPIIEEVIEDLQLSATVKSITLNLINSNVDEVFADQYLIKIILRNFISNAIKFTNSNGKVEVYLSLNQNCTEISILDNGVGISGEIQRNLFSIDKKFTSRGTAGEKGSGLGLVLCKEFVGKHGGRITVESKEGKGSNFKFTLPLNKS